jgi:hypothetical protein
MPSASQVRRNRGQQRRAGASFPDGAGAHQASAGCRCCGDRSSRSRFDRSAKPFRPMGTLAAHVPADGVRWMQDGVTQPCAQFVPPGADGFYHGVRCDARASLAAMASCDPNPARSGCSGAAGVRPHRRADADCGSRCIPSVMPNPIMGLFQRRRASVGVPARTRACQKWIDHDARR